MTTNDVIFRLKFLASGSVEDAEDDWKAVDIAISALEKQIPKKPRKYGINRLCPVCEWNVFPDIENAYCYKCGQALDWSTKE